MRKLLLAIAALGLLVGPIGAAQAQTTGLRDPFEPLLTQDTGDATTTGAPTDNGTDVDDPTAPDDAAPAPSDDGLPSTGADTTDWLAAAYVLLAIGGGLLGAARLTRAPAARTRS